MTASPEITSGSIVGGGFRVERPLSSGGMGAVYVATQLKTGRLRALKVMHASLAREPRFRERFEQEAQVGARIASEHVVEVVDAGVDTERGVPFLAMELLEGEDLETRVRRRGPLALAEVRRIFGELAHALSRAHAAGIVHRDLKPENVFLASARREGIDYTVKILDFGIAKIVAEAQSRATQQLGSPLWMAPEQTTPGAPITVATDLWALGLMAFYLLSGRSYWLTPNSAAPSQMMLLREVAFAELPPASARATHLGCASLLPSGFDAWFARAVTRVESERFTSVGELVAGLDALATTAVDAPAASSNPASMGEPAIGGGSVVAPSESTGEPAIGGGSVVAPSESTGRTSDAAWSHGASAGPVTVTASQGAPAGAPPSGPVPAASTPAASPAQPLPTGVVALPHTQASPGMTPSPGRSWGAPSPTTRSDRQDPSEHGPAASGVPSANAALTGLGPGAQLAPPPAAPRRPSRVGLYVAIVLATVAALAVLVWRLRRAAQARRDHATATSAPSGSHGADPAAVPDPGVPAPPMKNSLLDKLRARTADCRDLRRLKSLCDAEGDTRCSERVGTALSAKCGR